MATITTINASDQITNSRSVINTNFANLNSDKIETSYLDTDTTLAANSDSKIPTQKAVKTYIDSAGGQNASTSQRGLVEEATETEMLAKTATGGSGARLFVNPQYLAPHSKIFTAGEDLTAGQVVGVGSISGVASRAVRSVSSAAHGITTPLLSSGNHNILCPIGGDKFVYLNYTAAATDTLFAQVGQVDTSTKTLTLGTAATVATAFNPNGSSLKAATVCKLDTDKFAVFYILDSSGTAIKYRVGTVSGTTITFGSEATFVTAASTVAATEAFSADFISTDKGIFTYKAATVADSSMVAFTASGTTLTAGSGVNPGTNTRANATSMVRKIGTDKYVLVCANTSNSVYAQVCTLSGTTITAGTEVQISTTTSSSTIERFCLTSPDTDVFQLLYYRDVSNDNLLACTVSGTTPSAGTPITYAASTSNSGKTFIPISTTQSIVFEEGSGANLNLVTRSSTTLTKGTSFRGLTTRSIPMGLAMDNGDIIILDPSNSTNLSIWVYGMANNFVGVAQSTVSKGDSVTVLCSGIDSNQSSLNTGAIYTASSGSLALVSVEATTIDSAAERYVTALSSTEILL